MHKFLTFILLLSFKGFMAQLFVETQKIQSPDTVQYAYFGRALAISDGYLAASGNNAVHIYKRDAQGVWTFLRTINGTFGYQMDMSNDILAIEGNDEVHIYYRDQGGPEQWGWVKTLSSPDPNNEVNFPAAIDLWQDFLAISDDKAFSNSGRVYLFEKNLQGTDNWGKVNTFAVSGSDDLGTDVSIGGGKLAIGYPLKSGTWSFEGEVRIYDQNTGWGLDKVLSKSGAHGSYDMFGKSISIDDDKILVGANLGGPGGGFFHAEDMGGNNNWGQEASNVCSPFGRDIVDLQGNVAVAGRTGNEIQIFSRDTVNGQWFSSFVGTGSDNTQNGFGERVKCWNHTVITSNYNKDAYGLNSVGAVYIFEDTAYYNSNPPIIVGVEDEVINRWDMQIMNPFKDDLSIIVGNHLETSISIFDAKGQLIQEASFINSIDLNTSNWSRGIYYVTLLNTDGYTTKKLVKN